MSSENEVEKPALSAETLKVLQNDSGEAAVQLAQVLSSLSSTRVYSSSESSEEEEEEYEPFDYVAYYKEKFPERYQDVSEQVSNPRALITISDNYVRKLVEKAFKVREKEGWSVSTTKEEGVKYDYHWGEYEDIDWFSSDFESGQMVVSSYYNRKGLNRKGHLVHILSKWQKKYVGKFPIVPESYVIHPSMSATESGESVDCKQAIEESGFTGWNSSSEDDLRNSVWIFKPSVTNRADGIRLISNEQELIHALKTADELALAGGIVLQRYIEPLLINECKFHLRVFVLVVGNIEVYVSPDFLAIFSLEKYTSQDLSNTRAHLTNIAYQEIQSIEDQQRCMRSLDETEKDLVDSGLVDSIPLAQLKIKEIKERVFEMVKDTLEAVSSELTFQARSNCFEIFGFDFMISPDWNIWLLEANSQPDLAKAGDRLQPIIDSIIADTAAITTDGNSRFPNTFPTDVGLVKVFSRKQ